MCQTRDVSQVRYRSRVRAKYERFSEAVATNLPDLSEQLVVPQMSMWLRHPSGQDATMWADRARTRGVLVSAGSCTTRRGRNRAGRCCGWVWPRFRRRGSRRG